MYLKLQTTPPKKKTKKKHTPYSIRSGLNSIWYTCGSLVKQIYRVCSAAFAALLAAHCYLPAAAQRCNRLRNMTIFFKNRLGPPVSLLPSSSSSNI